MTLRTRQHTTNTPAKRCFFINRPFGLLWSGQTISALGSHITNSGIPLMAILVLGAHPAQIGLLAVASALPNLVFSLLIGVWVDRLPLKDSLMLRKQGISLLLGHL